jgi:hypothetical protein
MLLGNGYLKMKEYKDIIRSFIVYHSLSFANIKAVQECSYFLDSIVC